MSFIDMPHLPFSLIVLLVPLALVLHWLCYAFYNLFLHPLRSIPGPKLHAASGLPYAILLVRGRWPHALKALHDKHGPVVRYAPNDISYITPSAWKDIYSHATLDHLTFNKDLRPYRATLTSSANILIANDDDHSRMRRLLSHAFSERSLRTQEDIIKSYIDKLIDKLRIMTEGNANKGAVVDLVRWYNFVTFDLIGDLCFGEPFGCLDSGGYHPWVAMIFQGFKLSAFIQVLRRYPPAPRIFQHFLPRQLQQQQRQHQLRSFEKARTRVEKGSGDRPDFMSYILRYNDERGMSLDEIGENSNILIVAGSETTATWLSGTTFWLLKNPAAYQKVVDEVRSGFAKEEDINLAAVSQLKYLLAVLREGSRMYPPVPSGQPRTVPQGGAVVNGEWIAEGACVSVSHWAAYHSAVNFHLPDKFIPERWLDDPRFAQDRREVLEPFSYGPRNCLGKNLAYAEARLVLARMLWNFDLELPEETSTWTQQDIFIFWDKPPLNIKLKPRPREDRPVETT